MKKTLITGGVIVLSLILGSCFSFGASALGDALANQEQIQEDVANNVPAELGPDGTAWTAELAFDAPVQVFDDDLISSIEFLVIPDTVYVTTEDGNSRFPASGQSGSYRESAGNGEVWEFSELAVAQIRIKSDSASPSLGGQFVRMIVTDKMGVQTTLDFSFN